MRIFQNFLLEFLLNIYKDLKNYIVKNNIKGYKFNVEK